jgi:simple sugar transport system permease protein
MGSGFKTDLTPDFRNLKARGSLSAGFRSLFQRPELTAVVATIAVFLLFSITVGRVGFLSLAMTRNYLEVAAEIGIIAGPITLLLVAGEFDLSVGSMAAAAEIILSYTIVYLHWPLWAALAFALALTGLIGAVNGFLVVKTKLPSFIITLASLFIIRGATQAITRALTGSSTIGRIHEALSGDPLVLWFDASIAGLSVSLFWWIGVTFLMAWILDNTRFGNWIYATGGSLDAAQKTGVPTSRVKIVLYMATAMSTTIVAALAVLTINQGNSYSATGREFEVVTAAVIGGALLSGGYGSPIGTAFGAVLFGMVDQGFFFTSIPDQWYQVFLGLMLLISVIINKKTRELVMRPKRLAR